MFRLAPLPRTLAAALKDTASSKPEVRVSAIHDLGRLGSDRAQPQVQEALERLLASDPEPQVRAAAAEALADAGTPGSVPALLRALEDSSLRVRELVLLALGELSVPGDARSLQAVHQAFTDPRPELRFQALIALGRLEGQQATEMLIQGTRDQDPQVRYVAWRVLEEQWLEHPGSELPQMVRLRARAALSDEVEAVRIAAAILLGRSGDRAGASVLVDAVNRRRGTVDPEDEVAVVELVGELGLQAARPGLQRRAFGWWRRGGAMFQARVALARLGDDRAIESILADLGSRSLDRRNLALAAVAQARISAARPLILALRGDPGRADQQAVEAALRRIDGAPEESVKPGGRKSAPRPND